MKKVLELAKWPKGGLNSKVFYKFYFHNVTKFNSDIRK